ncbi:MAG: FHA domain-containing protein, partial [Planctomycetota bacterium]
MKPFELPIRITVDDGGEHWTLDYAGTSLLSIGRSRECDIPLKTDKASRHHAEIIGEDGHFTLVDSGSSNGTFVNETRVDRAELNSGDVIRIGEAKLVFGEPVAIAAVANAEPARSLEKALEEGLESAAPRSRRKSRGRNRSMA